MHGHVAPLLWLHLLPLTHAAVRAHALQAEHPVALTTELGVALQLWLSIPGLHAGTYANGSLNWRRRERGVKNPGHACTVIPFARNSCAPDSGGHHPYRWDNFLHRSSPLA